MPPGEALAFEPWRDNRALGWHLQVIPRRGVMFHALECCTH
jgi:hypothetical protein